MEEINNLILHLYVSAIALSEAFLTEYMWSRTETYKGYLGPILRIGKPKYPKSATVIIQGFAGVNSK